MADDRTTESYLAEMSDTLKDIATVLETISSRQVEKLATAQELTGLSIFISGRWYRRDGFGIQ
jgi:hypothetical protein